MPSPFPGMDPYLADPIVWPDFHHKMISEFQGVLNRGFRPSHRASVEERIYISRQDDPGRQAIIPDVVIKGPAGDANGVSPALDMLSDDHGDTAVA